MPSSAFSLQIPSPCAESWDAMTPRGAGRHCASCEQVVMDFTEKTDAEILAILKAAAGGHACGRLRPDQLGRPLRGFNVAPRVSRWSTAVAATLALLLGRSLTAPEARAQAPTNQHPNFGRHSPEPELGTRKLTRSAKSLGGMVTVAADTVLRTHISGRVVDELSGEGLPGVTVLLQGTQHGVSTIADGSFTLPVEPNEQHCAIMFSSIGYSSVLLPQSTTETGMTVGMETRATTGLLIIYPIYTPRGLWDRLRSIPYRVTNLFR
ncbi:carboxypeptidase-like regulatory domain-containing protein [Hymenobacter persicinus]|uniref:Carboxypeptidase-like regulatory domain-containing protein n=1 Tax=Hymenobacter persicinus TaxID=2025506 RepID=A0A4V1ZAY2_9BACT|nr:carboxypeptidase-like regulatory domain-containing protein [Hymenobacter persicinus]RYU81079.1 carboxypeptidase-like regulatory domain-containing protein [Hymenobacter persicinus]